jgi:hypothetical protein
LCLIEQRSGQREELLLGIDKVGGEAKCLGRELLRK